MVDDEAVICKLVAATLSRFGYSTIPAESAGTALAALADPSLAVDLLLTGVAMPGIDGRKLARRAAVLRPRLKILFMTGFITEWAPDAVVVKPFTRQALLAEVERALGAWGV